MVEGIVLRSNKMIAPRQAFPALSSFWFVAPRRILVSGAYLPTPQIALWLMPKPLHRHKPHGRCFSLRHNKTGR
eukprot:1085344-Pleurochrysis_carterae.AAC.1